MYSQLKSRIEQEKKRAENNLKNLEEIKNSPKRYVVYEESKSSSQSQASPIILKQINSFSPNGGGAKIDDNVILNQLKQITELKREEKIAKFSVQIEHLSRENSRLQNQITQLKGNISEKEEEMIAIENRYKQGICIYLQRCSKLQQEEANYKEIIREYRSNIQSRDQSITNLQKRLYELDSSLQFERQEKEKLKSGNKIIKMQKQQIINSFKMLHQSILSFFSQYETFVFSNFRKVESDNNGNDFQGKYLDLHEISEKFKIIHQNHLNSDLENNNLKIQIKKLNQCLENSEKKSNILEQELKDAYTEINLKIEAIELLEKKNSQLLVQNEEMSFRLKQSNQQMNQLKAQFVQKSNNYLETIQNLKQNVSFVSGQLTISRKNEQQNQQKLQIVREQLQQIKIKKEYDMIVLQNRQKQLSVQVQNLKGEINSLVGEQQVHIQKVKILEFTNDKLSEEILKLKMDLKANEQQLVVEKMKEQKERQREQTLVKQQHQLEKKMNNQIKLYINQVERIKGQNDELIRKRQQIELNKIELQQKNRQLKLEIQKITNECIRFKNDKVENEEKMKELMNILSSQQKKVQLLQKEVINQKNLLQVNKKQFINKEQQLFLIKKQFQQLKESVKQQNQNIKIKNQQRSLEFIHIEEQKEFQNHKELKIVQIGDIQIERYEKRSPKQQQIKKKNNQVQMIDYCIQCQSILLESEKKQQHDKQPTMNKIQPKTYNAEIVDNEKEVNIIIQKSKQQIKQPINEINDLHTSQKIEELLVELRRLQCQNILFKNSYLKLQVENLLNISNLSLSLSRINQKDYELNRILQLGNKMKEQITELGTQIITLTKKIENLQNGIARQKQIDCIIENNIADCITRIKHNCLKNNCDSVGIVNIQFGKYTYDGPKNLHLTSSPTDLQKFNQKQDIRSLEELKLYYDGENQEKNKVRGPYSVLAIGTAVKDSKKKTYQLKTGEMNKQNQKIVNEPMAKSMIKRVISQEYHQQNKQQVAEMKQEGSLQAYSTQNNADTQQISLLPYPLLLEKYRNLKIDLEKMQEYICHVHSVNFKIKKSIAEIDHYAKFNAISKIQEKLQHLVSHNQSFLKNETQQFVTQILKILSELQSYIHFVDHLSKIQPFTESKFNNHRFCRMKRRVTTNAKLDKQFFNKKTYSQGQSRQDDLLQHFDTNLYEQQEEFAHNEIQAKQPEKKQKYDIERYFQQKKQLYSQISSVKNQSLRSQNSFMNSKSQLWQLGAYLKNKMIEDTEEHEQSNNKKQSNDSQKLSQMSMKDIKKKYNKLKQQNIVLAKDKVHLQKVCKKLQHQQNEYKKKLQKMTKQFNDSFKLLCQISENKRLNSLKIKNEKNHVSPQVEKKDIQNISKQTIPKMEANSSSLSHVRSNVEVVQLEKSINDKNKKIKQLQSINQGLRTEIKQGEKKNEEKMQLLRLNYLKQLEVRTKKNNVDFAQFIEKIIEKMPIKKQIQILKPLINRKKSFIRKNSIKQIDVGLLLPQKLKPNEILELIGKVLNIGNRAQLREEMALGKLEAMLIQGVQVIIKKNNSEIFDSVFQNIKKFMAMQGDEQCFSEINIIRVVLEEYFGEKDKVNEFFHIIVDIVSTLKRDSQVSISNLSINSQCDEVKRIYGQQKHHFSQFHDESQDEKIKVMTEMQRDYQKMKKQNSQLQYQIKQIINKVNEKDNFIQIQQQELISLKEDHRIKLSEIQAENVYLKQQLSKLRQKPRKKAKIFYLNQ